MKKILVIITILSALLTVNVSAQPLTLEQCINIAMENNTTILNAKASLEDMRLQKQVSQAGYLPSISGYAGYSHSEQKTVRSVYESQHLNEIYTTRYYRAGIDLNQTIWDGGNTIAANKKSEADYKSTKYNFENTKQTLVYSVEEAYLNLLKQKQLLTVYEETLNSSQEALKKAESMEQVGATSRTDVLKARVKFEDDHLNLIKAQNYLDVAKANLNYIIGRDVNLDIDVVDVESPEPLDITFGEAVEAALESHPALKKASFDKVSSERTVDQAKSAFLPQLTGSYGFGTSSPALTDIANPFTKENQFEWSAGVTLSINLFDGFASPTNYQRAKVGLRSAQDNYEQARRDVVLEVKAAYLGMDEAQKSIAAAAERVLSAEEDFKLSTARYNLGAGTILEQIDAQLALTSAKAQKIQAEYNYKFAQSRLQKAIGKLKY
jgi:outer membrane protein